MRYVWGIAAFLILLVVAGVLAFRFSPEPGVWIVRQVFQSGDADLAAASAAFVPEGVIARTDLPYGDSSDELFDLFLPPPGVTVRPIILVWVHGGGFVAGSKSMPANWLKIVASQGFAVVSVEYVRGASRSYPKPVLQVNDAMGHVRAHAAELGIDTDKIVLGGDSAGAHIASQLALAMTDPTYAERLGVTPAISPDRLVGMVLASGIYALPDFDSGVIVRMFFQSVMQGYTGYRNLAEMPGFALFSIIDNVTPAFPPSFITGGNADPLTAQGKALAARLQALGVRTETLFFPDDHQPPLAHEYQFRMNSAEGRLAFRQMVEFLNGLSPAGMSG